MEKLKMVDLQGQYMRIKPDIDRAIQDVLMASAFIQGPPVAAFASELAEFTGAAAVIPCANGTDALQIAMMALDIKAGDEVIVPVHTYVATAEAISLLGITPVFVDVEGDTFNIDVAAIEQLITPRTKAVVPVHLYGQCANMSPLLNIARKHGLHVIEDAAQALGAEYIFPDGSRRQAGTMGIIGTTSFFPSKNLGCFGDGGAVFSTDATLGEKIKMIANHGQRVKYDHEVIGVNSRLDSLQAAVLSVKLKHLRDYMKRRSDAAATYDKLLGDVKGIRIPFRASYSTHVFNQYTLQVTRRDDLRSFLASEGIPTMIYYSIPLHLQTAYRTKKSGVGSFPITEELSNMVISLPIHTEMKNDELNHICNSIRKFYHG